MELKQNPKCNLHYLVESGISVTTNYKLSWDGRILICSYYQKIKPHHPRALSLREVPLSHGNVDLYSWKSWRGKFLIFFPKRRKLVHEEEEEVEFIVNPF